MRHEYFDALAYYSDEQRAEIQRVARLLSGMIIPTGGGMAAVEFTEADEDPDGYYLAALDDFDVWAVTFCRDTEDGAREWVDLALDIEEQSSLRDGPDEAEAEAFIVAGRTAKKGPLL